MLKLPALDETLLVKAILLISWGTLSPNSHSVTFLEDEHKDLYSDLRSERTKDLL